MRPGGRSYEKVNPASLWLAVRSWYVSCSTGRPEVALLHEGKKVTIMGTVSSDGKTILGERNTAWIVDNAEKLQNFLGHQVSVRGTLDPVTNRLLVLSVKMVQDMRPHTSWLGDSAFRRMRLALPPS